MWGSPPTGPKFEYFDPLAEKLTAEQIARLGNGEFERSASSVTEMKKRRRRRRLGRRRRMRTGRKLLFYYDDDDDYWDDDDDGGWSAPTNAGM